MDKIDLALDTRVPEAYRQFLTRHGAIFTPSILDEIAARKLSKPDIQEFLKPKQVIENNKMYWSGEMPTDMIGIASDCMGNMIGFRRQSASSDDSPVLFFDHEYVEVSEISPSFDEFLAWYLDNLQGPQRTNE